MRRKPNSSLMFSPMGLVLLGGLLIPFLIFLNGINRKIKPQNDYFLYFSKYRKLIKYIAAMARLESGDYTNTLSRDLNNIYSMRFPRVRPATNIGSTVLIGVDGGNFEWSKYKSYQQATSDLLLWMDYNKFPKQVSSVDQFAQELKNRSYFTSSLSFYTAGLKSYL
jgi:uncharacterized FlgJ-related protein